MKTAIIGGGRGCRAIIELALGTFLKELVLEISIVVDPDPQAPGMIFARQKGIPTTSEMSEVLEIPGIELIIELTGQDYVLENIYKIIPPGIKVIDHTFARIFWDLVNARDDQARQLVEITELERKIEDERRFLQSLFDTIPQRVAVMDKDKQIIKINARFGKFVGVTPSEAIGKTCMELMATTPLDENCRQTAHLLDEVIQDGQQRTLIWRSPPPDETFWELTHTPILSQKGKIDAVLSTWHRITDQVMLQRKFESAEL